MTDEQEKIERLEIKIEQLEAENKQLHTELSTLKEGVKTLPIVAKISELDNSNSNDFLVRQSDILALIGKDEKEISTQRNITEIS